MKDVECKACEAGLPLVWGVQERKNVHLRGLDAIRCARLDAHEDRQKAVANDRGNEDGRGR